MAPSPYVSIVPVLFALLLFDDEEDVAIPLGCVGLGEAILSSLTRLARRWR